MAQAGPESVESRYVLYGLPHSLYSGKVRAYLRKRRIDFVERPPSNPAFRSAIVGQIGRGVIPVLVCPDGTVLQDSADIIEALERTAEGPSVFPERPLQRTVSYLLQLYAVVGLTRHAMHYRWSFRDEQAEFLTHAFAAGTDLATGEALMNRMAGYLPMLSVTADTIGAIEQSYLDLLDVLDAHFRVRPYLLGAQPCLGDYAMFGPLFAHLGRDPVPSHIMKTRAPAVFRWVERMHAPEQDMPEYPPLPLEFMPHDRLPDTLSPLLKLMAQELFPELSDKAVALARYIAEHDAAVGQPVTAAPHRRIIGTVQTKFRGVPHDSGVQPYLFYLWQKVTDGFEALSEADQARIAATLEAHGLLPILTTPRAIRIERAGYQEVWGERIDESERARVGSWR